MKDPAVHLDGRIRDSSVAMMRKYGEFKERHYSTVTEGQMWPTCVTVNMHINAKFLCPLSEIEKVKLSPRHIK